MIIALRSMNSCIHTYISFPYCRIAWFIWENYVTLCVCVYVGVCVCDCVVKYKMLCYLKYATTTAYLQNIELKRYSNRLDSVYKQLKTQLNRERAVLLLNWSISWSLSLFTIFSTVKCTFYATKVQFNDYFLA